jgi:hypothetical protein
MRICPIKRLPGETYLARILADSFFLAKIEKKKKFLTEYFVRLIPMLV